ncbi:MAG: serine/threonine protein kinase [Hyphomicrobiaceae bacterium]|nr:MAG: serine/threonine protein kinase [Hyphomicrobiaceae bacterium]
MANQNEAVPAGTLPPGTRIGRYTLTRLLGQSGFGVTYLAEHQSLQRRVAIKEHFPREFAMRTGATVSPQSHAASTLKWARERFLEEARTLSGFRHPAINEVVDVFEANGTAYMVLAFEDAIRFGDWLDKLGRPPTQAELDRIVAPLAEALELIHARQFLHRDISPDNILIRPDGSPVLIDFGAARQALGKQTKTLTAMVRPGFSPPEQYDTDDSAKQGPWSDIYAFSATLYRAVTGTRPPESTGRVLNDRYWSAQGVADRGYRRSFLEAIDLGLRVDPDARPRSVGEWKTLTTS